MTTNDPRCVACHHPRSFHTERLRGCPELCCPLPCECLGFVSPDLYADRSQWCPHSFARITSGKGQGLSACPDCSAAPGATVYTRVHTPGDSASAALRCFGPGTTDGGRAEAGWRCAGRIVEPLPEAFPVIPEAAVDGWDPGRVIRSRFP